MTITILPHPPTTVKLFMPSPSEEEEFSYTPPTSRDGSLATLVPTPKPTPPPSPPPSPPPHEESSPIPPLTALVSTPNPTPPPTSPRLEQPIGLQDELVVTPQVISLLPITSTDYIVIEISWAKCSCAGVLGLPFLFLWSLRSYVQFHLSSPLPLFS